MTTIINTQGIHPTSLLCIEALQWLHTGHQFRAVLDMGCGDGMLSLAAAKMWNVQVLAVDISEAAVADARANAAAHRLNHLVTAARSDGLSDPVIKERAPYDLIIFNLLAEPIMEWASEVKSHLAPGGVAILSGILAWKAEPVKTLYETMGFKIIHTLSHSPWEVLVVRR